MTFKRMEKIFFSETMSRVEVERVLPDEEDGFLSFDSRQKANGEAN